MDRFLRNLHFNEVFRDNLPVLIDAFVNFYGEEYRDYITERFTNMIVIGYFDYRALNSLVSYEQNEKSKEIVKEVFEKLGIPNTKENYEKYMGIGGNFIYPDVIPIIKIAEYIELVKNDPDELVRNRLRDNYEIISHYITDLTYEDFINHKISPEQLKRLPKFYLDSGIDYYWNVTAEDIYNRYLITIRHNLNIHPGLTEDNINELIKKGELDYLLEYSEIFKEASEKYKAFISENLQQFVDLANKMKNKENEINKKYFLKALLEFKEYFSPEDQAKLEEAERTGNFEPYRFKSITKMFGYSLNGQNLFEFFNERCDKKLANPGTNSFYKGVIKDNRIMYFKCRGIDLGDDYDAYVNDPRCKEIWPTYDEIEKIKQRFDYYLNEYNIELYSDSHFYFEAMEQAEKVGLIDKENVFGLKTISQRMTCVYPNFIEKDGEYVSYPMVAILSQCDEQSDVRLIHELNHVLEISLLEVKNNEYKGICGWDYFEGSIYQGTVGHEDTVHEEPRRDYELFNEIVNELIAQKISKMMHDNGVYIFTDKDNCKDYGGTTYERSLVLVREFFDTYIDDIIASRRNNNLEAIWNRVGKKNFDSLNDLFHEFFESFPEFDFYQLIDDLKNNRDTKLVRMLSSIKDKRDVILQAMKEYSLSSQVTL